MKEQTRRNLMAMLVEERAKLLEKIAAVERGDAPQMLADYCRHQAREGAEAKVTLVRVEADIVALENEVCAE